MPISKRVRASEETLSWGHRELVRNTFDPTLIFSVEKILQYKILLHIRANDELYAQWMHHGGKLGKRKSLQENDIDKSN